MLCYGKILHFRVKTRYGILDENIHFTNIYEHFKYLIKTSQDKELFKEKLLKDILIDYEDALDEKLNKFIESVLTVYPFMFLDNKEIKTEKNIYNSLSKAKHQDKILRDVFIDEINDGDFSIAVDTLYKKKFYTNNQNSPYLKTLNYWINTELSISNMSKLLEADINDFTDNKKVKTKALKKYLKEEILLRIDDLSPEEKGYKKTNEYISYNQEEKKLIMEEILLALEDKKSPEDIWYSF